jgi:hypothetical protein
MYFLILDHPKGKAQMNIDVTQQNIAHAALAACRATPRPMADKLADPMAGFASPAGIASAAAAARGSMPETALLLAAFRRLASVQGNKDLHLLCIELETVFEKGGV